MKIPDLEKEIQEIEKKKSIGNVYWTSQAKETLKRIYKKIGIDGTVDFLNTHFPDKIFTRSSVTNMVQTLRCGKNKR